MSLHIGVDVGGTFTDAIVFDDVTGVLKVAKGRSTADAPEVGVLDVIDQVLDRPALASAEYFLHATTVGLNALLQRAGGAVGLITTDGFRDVLEIRRGTRDDLYGLLWGAPAPLVPRRRRLGVAERVMIDGTVDRPLDEAGVRRALDVFRQEDVRSIAVVYINSYANPEHELRTEAVLREAGFTGTVSLSHLVTGIYGEYERTCTTVVDAFVRPVLSGYLRRLEDGLTGRGFSGSCLITRSGAGALTFQEADTRPFETLMSGPVAGVAGTQQLCGQLGYDRAITADVGGTSFDTSLIVDGEPRVKYEGEVAGMPLQTPWVDVRSIGAGGGSLARAEAGLLRVGPQSAGAVPGPACYGRGGTEPTVTDAAAVLGMLAHGELAGGLRLDLDAARLGLATLGERLGLGTDEAAQGVLTVATAAMAGAIRSITIEAGEDPREAVLVAYGGAGPLFGTLLARELGIRTIAVPVAAGNFSAWGLLCADMVQTAARTVIRPLDDKGLDAVNKLLSELLATIDARRGGAAERVDLVPAPSLDLRYAGQEHTLTANPPADGIRVVSPAAEVAALFAAEHERTFGHRLDGTPVEIVSVRATARGSRALKAAPAPPPPAGPSAVRTIDAYSFTTGRREPFTVIDRGAVGSRPRWDGPLIVLEETTTTYVDRGFHISQGASGVLLIEQAGEEEPLS
jgi:N-methylhydantoinase A